jgi:hypothetical protein
MFKEFYETLKAKGPTMLQNVVAEYSERCQIANQRYGKDYKRLLICQTEAALSRHTGQVSQSKFSGFLANIEDACKMTLWSGRNHCRLLNAR